MKVENEYRGNDWTLYNGDCIEVAAGLPDGCMDFSIFSPPFSNLFVYSDSERDMGNCKDDAEFLLHFGFLVKELYRITRDGRLCAVHCSQLPKHKYKDGTIGLKDFRGDLIRAFEHHGWVYHSEVCIWKDPVVEMTRTKAQGLLHKQIKKDSTFCRQGMPDYLIVFRKPTEATRPVHRAEGFDPADYVGEMAGEVSTSVDVWQRYASPVWLDIRQTRVLNAKVARADQDERHICPLQLDVIERAIHLWTLPGDVVFTPFAGIGSEMYGAVLQGRKAVGIELKPEYARQAAINMRSADESRRQGSLMEMCG